MAGRLEGIVINKCIHRNFGSMAVFRFQPDYVNYPFSMIFWALLHNLSFGGIAGNDAISSFRQWTKIEDFFRYS